MVLPFTAVGGGQIESRVRSISGQQGHGRFVLAMTLVATYTSASSFVEVRGGV